MKKERRAKDRRSGGDRRVNATRATELLREDHRRIEGYFEDMEETEDILAKSDIRDLAVAEIRVHKAVVEEVFYPAVADLIGEEALAEEAREELEELEPMLEMIETTSPSESSFEALWQKLARQLAHHIQWEEQELLIRAEEKEGLDLLKMGLRLAELRREVMAEQPTVNWETQKTVEESSPDI